MNEPVPACVHCGKPFPPSTDCDCEKATAEKLRRYAEFIEACKSMAFNQQYRYAESIPPEYFI